MNDYDKMCSDAPDVTDLANFEEPGFDEDMIMDWATSDKGGGLPSESAAPFASWLDSVWNDYDNGSGTQTNEDILKGAVAYWTGR